MKDGESITTHLQRMQKYVDRLLKLNAKFDEDLAIDIILQYLPACYEQFKMTYHMNKDEVTLSKLQELLRTIETGLKGKAVASNPTTAAPVLAIGQGKGKKRKGPYKSHKGMSHDGSSSSRTKGGFSAPSSNPEDAE
ncbi:uncharacterized protein LOC128132568 [Lactuca sativa]|uniref:uncharacterized protein LOC128132568 n=1 Tax=Lactuca sativa TaxID=4236 RepID=UPI0022AE940E|nr:uncharacterized protein LOC128132568 [Lactuca sativa]